jgi:hypothetical protein
MTKSSFDSLLTKALIAICLGCIALTSQPVRASEGPICSHQGLLETLSIIRTSCLDGSCDIDAMLDKINPKVGKADFLAAVSRLTNGTAFFRSGQSTLSPKEKQAVKSQLAKSMGPMVENPDNSVMYLIGKASKVGTTQQNRTLASQRVATVYRLVEQLRKKGVGRCKQYYRSYVGEERFQISEDEASEARYGTSTQWKRRGNEPLNAYINQSVAFFVYPCFREMCQYLKTNLGRGCGRKHPKRIFPECRPIVCQDK